MTRQELKNEVKLSLKATLNSSANALSLRDLAKDYNELNGSIIPYRELGYSSLLEFLRAIPDTVKLSNPESLDTWVYPVIDAKSAHISKLVVTQKKPSKPKKRFNNRACSNFPSRLAKPARRRPQRTDDFISNEFRGDVLRILEKNPKGMHLDAFEYEVSRLAYNCVMNVPFEDILSDIASCTYVVKKEIFLKTDSFKNNKEAQSRKSVTKHDDFGFSASDSETDYLYDSHSLDSSFSEDCSPAKTSTAQPRMTNGVHRTPKNHNVINDLLLEKVGSKLIKNLQELFKDEENQNGIWLVDLEPKYQMKYGYELSPKTHGFNDTLELAVHLKDVFRLKRFRHEGEYLLEDARKKGPIVYGENGEIPSSFIVTLKNILNRRTVGSLSTNDLATEYKRYCGQTLDPKEFGFDSMDSFLKNLEEFNSDFRFLSVKDRVLIRLNSFPPKAHSSRNSTEPEVLSQNGTYFNPFPSEVCNTHDKLPPDPFFESVQKYQVFPVTLAEVYSPWRFYLHHSTNVEMLNRMMDDMNSFYVENEKEYEVLPTAVAKGLLCVCQYSADNRWHRVIVTSTKLKTAKVRFVDYGTVEDVNVTKLRYLHRNYSHHHTMSIRAKLSGIQQKKNIDPDSVDQYTARTNQYFFNIASAVELEAKLINFDAKAECYDIELYIVTEKDESISVANRLVEEGFADRKTEDMFTQPIPLNKTETKKPVVEKVETMSKPNLPNGHVEMKNEPKKHPIKQPPTFSAPSIPQSIPSVPIMPHPPPPLKKGPPPGLSLPTSVQSQNYSKLYAPPLMTSSGYLGAPLISQSTMLNSPFCQSSAMNVPPLFLSSVPSSFDTLLTMSRAAPAPYNVAAPLSSNYSPYSAFYPTYSLSSNPPPPYMQRPQPPPPPLPTPLRRLPPGIFPMGHPSIVLPVTSNGQQTCLSPSPDPFHFEAGVYQDVLTNVCSGCSLCPPPPMTMATTTTTTAINNTDSTFSKVEFPITDMKLAAAWEKKRSEASSDSGHGKKETGEEMIRSKLQQTANDPPLVNCDTTVVNATTDDKEAVNMEVIRESQGVESTFKKYFDNELLEKVHDLLERQEEKIGGSKANIATIESTADSYRPASAPAATSLPPPPTPVPHPVAPPVPIREQVSAISVTRSRTPQPVSSKPNDSFGMEAMLQKLIEESRVLNAALPENVFGSTINMSSAAVKPVAMNDGVDGAVATSAATSPLVNATTASSPQDVEAPKFSKTAAKLNPIKQFVMQYKKV